MFSFEKLQHEGKSIPVKATVQSVLSNDETLDVAAEGILSRGNDTLENTTIAGTGGAIIGGLAGGWKGFGIGAGIGSGAALGPDPTCHQSTGDSHLERNRAYPVVD